MSNKRSGENPEDTSGSESGGENDASNIHVPTDIVKDLMMKDDEIEKDVRNLETRIERLETGNASGGNSSIAAAPPQKPKKKLLSDEEAEIFRRNGETKAKVDDAIEREDNITPTALTKKLVEILFTEDERKVSSIRNLGYWRLQYIKVDPPLAAANDYEEDEDDEDNETTDEEDNN